MRYKHKKELTKEDNILKNILAGVITVFIALGIYYCTKEPSRESIELKKEFLELRR